MVEGAFRLIQDEVLIFLAPMSTILGGDPTSPDCVPEKGAAEGLTIGCIDFNDMYWEQVQRNMAGAFVYGDDPPKDSAVRISYAAPFGATKRDDREEPTDLGMASGDCCCARGQKEAMCCYILL